MRPRSRASAALILLLLAGPAFAGKDEDLLTAAMTESLANVELALKQGANPNYSRANGETPLHVAAYHGSADIAAALIAKGADIKARKKTGETPLWVAIESFNEDQYPIVKLLIEKGADFRETKDGNALIHTAARFGTTDTLRVLLDAGLPVDLKSANGDSSLCIAAYSDKRAPAMELLLSRGADVNFMGHLGTPLHRAVTHMRSNPGAAKLLLEHGANPNTRSNEYPGEPPLMEAMMGHDDEAAEAAALLLSKGADVNGTEAYYRQTALHLAAELNRRGAARVLLAAGADPDAMSTWNKSPRSMFMDRGIDIDTLLPFNVAVNRFVQSRLDPWLKKDEYESAAGYTTRMKGKKAKVGELMGAAFERFEIWKSVTIGLYDAESETFKLTIKEIGDIIVHVPREKARDFKEKFSKFSFKPQFAAAGKGWTLSRLEMRGVDGASYAYDSSKQANYKPVVFDVKSGAAVDTALFGGKEIKTEVRKVVVAAADDVGVVPKFAGAASEHDVAVVIGIESYRGLPKSAYSRVDAQLVKRYLLALGYKERNIALLTDDKATYIDIKKTLETWLRNVAKPESSVFVYYSGHGAPEPASGEGYIVPYDGDPEYLQDTAYPLKKLIAGLNGLGAKQAVLILDSCFSGMGGRSVLAKNARPLVARTAGPELTAGVAMMTASTSDQISTSSEEFGHGVFTYYFLKALKDGKKDLSEIYGYALPLVEDEARRQNARQSPTMSPSADKAKGRFALAR